MRSSILSPPQPIKSKSKSYILTVFQKLLELKQITSLLRFTQRHAHGEQPQVCPVAFGSLGPHTVWLGHLCGKLVDHNKSSDFTESK